jgi:hypothetical protein
MGIVEFAGVACVCVIGYLNASDADVRNFIRLVFVVYALHTLGLSLGGIASWIGDVQTALGTLL